VLIGAAGVPSAGQDAAAATSQVGLLQLASELGPITSIASAGDSRLFLTQRDGQIVVWDGRGLLPRPFLDISRRVSSGLARGLFSVAFHPKYAANGLFFVSYTDTSGNLAVARYKRSAKDSNRADVASGIVLLKIPLPANADHSGGELQFGPDGYLYLGVGDGGSGEDSPCNAQRDDVPLGKILRLNVKKAARLSGKTVEMVWAKGLRDPRQFSFDRATGDLYIGDVGQTSREEINFQERGGKAGRNYGWRVMEGSICAAAPASGCPREMPPCKSPTLEMPIYEYSHEGGDCAVVGGYVYRGSHLPELSGVYFYGDSCSGRIWGGMRPMAETAPGLSTFGQDASGELYLGTENGALYRIVTPQEAIRYELTVREDSEEAAMEEPPPPLPILQPTAAPTWVPAASDRFYLPFPQLFPNQIGAAAPAEAAPAPEEPPPEPTQAPPPTAAPETGRMQPTPAQRDLPPPRTVGPHR
jgi:glucose/arabinose dehydrogenase